jgi:pyruvate dehydrogenase E2 component (dihydrolipoamide acetyltransferase)
MSEFRMPSLGADMEAGTLVEWLAEPGASVKRGDIVAVVETDKGAIEIEIFEDGVLERHLVEPGTTVPVGTPIAEIRTSGEAPASAPAIPAGPSAAPSSPALPQHTGAEAAPPPLAHGGLRASPAARRLAAQHGLDLASVSASGPDGVIVLADIEAALARAGAAAPARATFNLDQMRSAIAAAMSRSKREIPHYYLSHSLDARPAVDFVAKVNAARTPDRRLLLGALYVKATALAARKYPEFNGRFSEGQFKASAAAHVGVAISIRGGGLVAPAIHDVADLELEALMAGMRDLVARVRAGRFRSSEIADPTITVSSLGDRGVDALWGVIYPPQVALVGFGKVAERPWAAGGVVSARPVVTATLAADHRVSDGHRGALFLARIGELLSRPEDL